MGHGRLLGIAGPLTGRMALQRIGILGYGVGLPVACFILAAVFRQPLTDVEVRGPRNVTSLPRSPH